VQQKIVIKVQMSCDKCRSKALALVAAAGGVDSVAIAGADRDQVVVVGEGVDSIHLTTALRRKVGPAHILQVGENTKEADKKPPAAHPLPDYYPWCYPPPPAQPAGFLCDPYGYTRTESSGCSIM
jgi:hypothetical protein